MSVEFLLLSAVVFLFCFCVGQQIHIRRLRAAAGHSKRIG